MTTEGLVFAGGGAPDYARRLSRLRWRRRFPRAAATEAALSDRATEAFAGAAAWIAVRDELAVPIGDAPVPPLPGQVVLPGFIGAFGSGPPHTLAELERSDFRADVGASVEAGARAPALVFRSEDFAAARDESVETFLLRLASPPTRRAVSPGFGVFCFEDASARARPELTRLVPGSCRRLLDVGCGAGGVSAELLRLHPECVVEGIERSPEAAALARRKLSRVHEGDARDVLARLADEGQRYDAFLFADVLEHLADPVEALALARRLASPGATLVASVPNAGHVSLVRDLARGRFDPVPAGLADAGHLRWFTRQSLAESLEEAGWSVVATETSPGAPARGAAEFIASVSEAANLDRESLQAYQWIAVARPRWTGHGPVS